MNQIAHQIDQAADILRATNNLLEARAKHRDAQAHGNVHKVIDAYVKVVEAERYLAQMYPPADAPEFVAPDMTVEPLNDCGETKDEHADYYGRNRSYRTADERADDPRRYEVTK